MIHTLSHGTRPAERPSDWASAEARRSRLVQQQQQAAAQDDYSRLRRAFMTLAQADPSNAMALSMLGNDLDRAHARMQSLSGLDMRPEQITCSRALLRELGQA